MKKSIILAMIFLHAAVSMSQDITVEPIRQLGYGTVLVTGSGDGTAMLWDTSDYAPYQSTIQHFVLY